ncbi:MAG TPA: urease accessory protein UreH [Blastocatellia bacterium]|nr:urease accessory protein UreH [Blastocatellia bacterium]
MDASILAALSLGFFLGLRHALDPDHLVAVSTIVSEHKSIARSSLIGTFWGLGHTVSLFAIGMIVISLRSSIPQQAAIWMEMSVAAMLVALGLNVIRRSAGERAIALHAHSHTHEGKPPHKHLHLHNEANHEHRHHIFRLGRKPFVVGLVHGVAGSAALTLAVMTQIPSVALGLAYITLFGVGSVGGMLLMSAMISLPFAVTARRYSLLNWAIRMLAGLSSVIFGLMLAWELIKELRQLD